MLAIIELIIEIAFVILIIYFISTFSDLKQQIIDRDKKIKELEYQLTLTKADYHDTIAEMREKNIKFLERKHEEFKKDILEHDRAFFSDFKRLIWALHKNKLLSGNKTRKFDTEIENKEKKISDNLIKNIGE